MANTVLNILGFHRSGTSALAGQLNALGFPLGFENEERSEENPRGFFEHPLVRSINERALGQLKSAWFDWSLTSSTLAQRLQDADLDSLREEAAAFLASHFSNHASLLVKDPRMMRMAWFWEPLFEEARIKVSDIIIVRSPAECAASQVVRAAREPEFYQSLSTAEGMSALWCADHVLMLEHLAKEERSALLVWHKDLMTNPQKTLDVIIGHLKVEAGEAERSAAQSAIDSKLYRQKQQNTEGPWGKIADELFSALRAATEGDILVSASATTEFKSVLRRLRAMQIVIAPAADPLHVAAERWRDRDAAVTGALIKALKAIGHAANCVPVEQLAPLLIEIENLIATTGRRGLFLGVLATALLRSDRKKDAQEVLEEILKSGKRNEWAERQLKALSAELD